MSYVIVTDVFCDGEDCFNWTHGATGPAIDRVGATERVACEGWKAVRGKHYCPECCAEEAKRRGGGR